MEILNFIINYQIFGNTLKNLIIFLLILFITYILTKIIKKIFNKNLQDKLKQSENKIIALFQDDIYLILKMTIYIGGIYLAILQINFPNEELLKKTIQMFVILPILYVIMKFVLGNIKQYFHEKSDKDKLNEVAINLIIKILNIFAIVILFLLFLSNLGYDITALLTGVGIGGLAFALAAQDILKNVFSGFMLIFDKTFKKGERITFEGITGVIQEISIRSTKIRTIEGTIMTIPNSKLAESNLENVTKRPKERVKMTIGLTYDTSVKKLELAKKIIFNIIDKEKTTDSDSIWVWFDSFGDFSLNLQVIYYGKFKLNQWPERVYFKDRINMAIKTQFEKNKINMAFPTQTIEIKKV